MRMTESVRSVGRSATTRAHGVRHGLKDRMLERRLDRARHETERLEQENSMLRDQLEESHEEHRRILDLIDERLARSRSAGGRVLLLLLAGLGAYAWTRVRDGGLELPWSRAGSEAPASRLAA